MRKRIWVVILACLCFTTLARGQIPSTEGTGRITGHVYDSETLEPLEAASVMLLETMELVNTAADGVFVFEKVTPGQYTILAQATNYQEEEKTVNATEGQTVELQFYLPLQLSLLRKILRIFYSPPMLEFYVYAGTFLIIWLFAAILGRLLNPTHLDLSANSAWLTMIIVHIIFCVVFILHLLISSLRDKPWYYIPAWLLPYLAFMMVDVILIAFLIKQRRDLTW